jgi:carbon monoxide dehydrogenase subunit G
MRIEESIEINRSPEEVYEFVANVNNLPKCSDAIEEVRNAPDGSVSEGDTYTSVAKVMGRTVETSHKVLAARFPEFLDIDGQTGKTKIRVTIEIEPTPTGSRITQRGEGEPGGALRFVGGMVERTMRKQLQDDLANIKRLLESESPS